jgi:hypothetical protein
MYQAGPDPYCYPGTDVLRNKAGLTTAEALEAFETAMTFARSEVRLSPGSLPSASPRPRRRRCDFDLGQDILVETTRLAGSLDSDARLVAAW